MKRGPEEASRVSFLQVPAFRSLAAVALVAIFHTSARADTLQGRVVGITDGDTLTVLAQKRSFKVRLAAIDAPERRQPFGRAARQALAEAAFDKSVIVLFRKRDRYGRLVGKLLVDGTDAGLSLLQAGLAWHYLAFAGEQTPSDRQAYADAEQAARLAGRGLWAQSAPMSPWEFRLSKQDSERGRRARPDSSITLAPPLNTGSVTAGAPLERPAVIACPHASQAHEAPTLEAIGSAAGPLPGCWSSALRVFHDVEQPRKRHGGARPGFQQRIEAVSKRLFAHLDRRELRMGDRQKFAQLLHIWACGLELALFAAKDL